MEISSLCLKQENEIEVVELIMFAEYANVSYTFYSNVSILSC